eukprot:c15638_g1_i1 orf=106-672(+)
MADAMPVDTPRSLGETGNGSQETEAAVKEEQPSEAEEGSGEEEREGGGGDEEEEEEAGECGFCLFMKSGPCRDSFVNWEKCVEEAEKGKEDMVEKCHQVTFMLKECMEHNSDYYEPVLQAEKAMGEAALQEDEEAAKGGDDGPPDSVELPSQSGNQQSSQQTDSVEPTSQSDNQHSLEHPDPQVTSSS